MTAEGRMLAAADEVGGGGPYPTEAEQADFPPVDDPYLSDAERDFLTALPVPQRAEWSRVFHQSERRFTKDDLPDPEDLRKASANGGLPSPNERVGQGGGFLTYGDNPAALEDRLQARFPKRTIPEAEDAEPVEDDRTFSIGELTIFGHEVVDDKTGFVVAWTKNRPITWSAFRNEGYRNPFNYEAYREAHVEALKVPVPPLVLLKNKEERHEYLEGIPEPYIIGNRDEHHIVIPLTNTL